MAVSLVVVVFIIVVFVIAHCLDIYIAPHGTTAARLSFPHQLLFKKVVLKTGDAIYYFRVETIKMAG